MSETPLYKLLTIRVSCLTTDASRECYDRFLTPCFILYKRRFPLRFRAERDQLKGVKGFDLYGT